MGATDSFGDSATEANEAALEAVATFMQTMVPRGCMVQRFVLIVEAIDEDERALFAYTAPHQKRWDSMGLLQWGLSMEQSIQLVADQDDEDDDPG